MNIKALPLTITGFSIGLNITLTTLAKTLGIPFIFLDTVGTILSGALLGPFFGALTGLITNVITSLVKNPIELPFAIVNMTVGLVAGFIAKKFGFNLKIAVLTGFILAILCPLVGTPISVSLFGGLTGGTLDVLTGFFVKSGEKIFNATFFSRIISNLNDKIVSCIVVAMILEKIPKNIYKKITS